MEFKATFKYIRKAPRKMRPVATLIKGKGTQEALSILRFQDKWAAKDISKLIQSAVANANQKGGVREDKLFVKNIVVDSGPILKRFMPRARGSASSIHKRMSHVTVTLDERI